MVFQYSEQLGTSFNSAANIRVRYHDSGAHIFYNSSFTTKLDERIQRFNSTDFLML